MRSHQEFQVGDAMVRSAFQKELSNVVWEVEWEKNEPGDRNGCADLGSGCGEEMDVRDSLTEPSSLIIQRDYGDKM